MAPTIVRVAWILCLSILGFALAVASASAWEQDLCNGEARALAVTATGDVVAAGTLLPLHKGPPDHPNGGTGVVKLRGSSGELIWKRILGGDGHDLALDGRDNVIVAAEGRHGYRPVEFTVVKLGAMDGKVRWRRDIQHAYAFAVATDPHGDVVAAGSLGFDNGIDNGDWVVEKLSRSHGTVRWRFIIPGGPIARSAAVAVAVDPGGDVVAAGKTMRDSATTNMTAVKLRGTDGREIWRHDVISPGGGSAGSVQFPDPGSLQVDSAGDVIVAGQTGYQLFPLQAEFAVIKLAGSDGAERWRHIIGEPGYYTGAYGIAVDPGGAVVAVGALPQPATAAQSDWAALKLDGDDGHELWRTTIDGTRHIDDSAHAVAVNSTGDVAVAGFVQDLIGPNFLVTSLRGADGTERSRWLIGTGDGDDGWALTTDHDGRIIAAGSTGFPACFTVASLP